MPRTTLNEVLEVTPLQASEASTLAL
ncbi:hypothetical protein AZE42_08268 [Rhizopogon vesiculosus]|uniref:Uncharacterized protein n=1 Tax=Rhizopogon vesiculosus TaxID=180088 RepID=A0A1J8PQ92_9AGAM|nr:hypothetical protein AZE42_08268 [Rhizopogon vesiculosus]